MSKKTFQVWGIWVVVSLFYAYQYILRVLPSILLPDIIEKFHLSPEVFGQFSGVYYIGYSLLHLPIGAALDRYGVRRVLPGFIFLTVLGTLSLVHADSWWIAVCGRACVGIGSSAAILGVFKIVRGSFPEHFSRMLSFSVMLGLVGAIYGGGPVHYARKVLGFEPVVYLLSVLGLLLGAVTFFSVPSTRILKSASSLNSFLKDVRSILLMPAVVGLCLIAGFMVGPLEGFADVWGTQFLKVIYHLDAPLAASLPSLIFLGMGLGGPILSLIVERTGRNLEVLLGCGVSMFCGFALLLSGDLPIFWITCVFLLIGICCAYQVLAIDQISRQVPARQVGITTAMANMVIMLFGYLFHGVIGRVVTSQSSRSLEALNGVFGSEEGLLRGIAVIPSGILLSIIGIGSFLYMQRHKNAS